jgi:ribosomal protein L11
MVYASPTVNRTLGMDSIYNMEVTKRFASMTRKQKVTIYYTATKSAYADVDSVVLDDIDY